MTDQELRLNVIDELNFEPSVNAAHIGVAADNGVVTLSGHVSSYAEKVAAEQAVRRIKGVRGVALEIEVRYPNHKQTADDEIAQRALSIVAWDALVPSDAVKVTVEKGWVTLRGEVRWQWQKRSVEDAIRRLSGVVGIVNTVVVKPDVAAANVKDKIERALARNAHMEAKAIKVKVDGATVRLEGTVDSWDDRFVAETAAWSVPGVRDVDDRLKVA